jgi:exosortase A
MQKTAPIRADEATGTEVEPPAFDPSAKGPVPAAPRIFPASGNSRGMGWRRQWMRSLIVFTICSILLLWGFRSEIAAAVEVWSTSRTFGHAFFIFPITLFLFYRLRHRLVALQPRAAPWALIPAAAAMLCWMIGDLATIQVVKQLAFVAVWQSLFLLVFGWRVTRTSLFPLAYTYLAVPFGISLIPILQDITAQILVHLLRFSGVPVFLEGFQIEIPTGNFLVAEACSGVRYLMVCIALGILAAYLFFRSWPRRILFVALAILVPIVANGIRAYGIVMIAHYGHYEFAAGLDHVVYGFIFLSVVTLSLLSLGALLRDGHHQPLLDPANRPASVPAPGPIETTSTGSAVQILCAVVAVALVFSAQLWTWAAKAPPPNRGVILHAPVVASPWVLDGEVPIWAPTFYGTDAELQQGYRLGQERVDLDVGYYAYQRQGAEAVSDLNTISSGSEGKVLRSQQMRVQIADIALPVNELVILHGDRPFLVWQWYRIGDESTNSRLAAKLLEMRALVTGGDRAAAIIVVSAELSKDEREAAVLLKSFLQQGLDGDGALFQVEPLSTPAAMAEPQFPPDPAGQAVNP